MKQTLPNQANHPHLLAVSEQGGAGPDIFLALWAAHRDCEAGNGKGCSKARSAPEKITKLGINEMVAEKRAKVGDGLKGGISRRCSRRRQFSAEKRIRHMSLTTIKQLP
ncbi:hypothetical protein, partial [Paracoccus aestuariivivens]|uniref:hypothetical protein n=1 Tax=Paracoccus aestuariivivens TaxID=1820333 RepID=UPI001B8D71D0